MHELLQKMEEERQLLLQAIAKQLRRAGTGMLSDAVLAQSQRLDGLIVEVQRARVEAEQGSR